jgi:hypothetical protein
LSANPIARAAIARERLRRLTERREHLEIFKRIFQEAPGDSVRLPVIRRILRICGLKLTRPEILDVMLEAFPQVVYGKERAFIGIRVRRGFSAADLGEYLRRKFERSVGGPEATSKKPADAVDGVVAEYEAILESEGLPSDVNDIRDPVGRSYRSLPEEDPPDAGDAGVTHVYATIPDQHRDRAADGWGRLSPLAWWPSKSTPEDPSISPDIAAVKYAVAEMAYRIPGFFSRIGTGPTLNTMWRLTRLEGMTYPAVGKIVGKTANAVKLAVYHTEKRLLKHLRALGEPNVKRLFDVDRPISATGPRDPIRYLYRNLWESEDERRIWEKVAIEKATPKQAASELGLDFREVGRIVRRHRIRAALPVDAL